MSLDFNILSTPPPPYHSISTPLPNQLTKKLNQPHFKNHHASGKLNSIKGYLSSRFKNTSTFTPSLSSEKTSITIKNNVIEQNTPTGKELSLNNHYTSLRSKSFSTVNATIEQYLQNNQEIQNNKYDSSAMNINSNDSYQQGNHDGLISSTVNESLERIGKSLQNLIEEAQASLVLSSNYAQNNLPPQTMISNDYEQGAKESFADYSYRYIQRSYIQSQEKLTTAIEQLEQSIQNMLVSNNQPTKEITYHHHHHHHHYIKEKSYKQSIDYESKKVDESPKKNKSNKWQLPLTFSLLLAFIGFSTIRKSNTSRYGNLCLILLLITSLYRKQNMKRRFPVVNMVDRFMIQLTISKGATPLLRFIHRINVAYLCMFFLQ